MQKACEMEESTMAAVLGLCVDGLIYHPTVPQIQCPGQLVISGLWQV